MEMGRVFFNATAYLVLEESGDSEDECSNGGRVKVETAVEEEDAQSCCSYACVSDNMSIQEEEDYADCCEESCYSSSEEEWEDGVVDQCEVTKGLNPSKTCEGSITDERERDRLFWEACLAS